MSTSEQLGKALKMSYLALSSAGLLSVFEQEGMFPPQFLCTWCCLWLEHFLQTYLLLVFSPPSTFAHMSPTQWVLWLLYLKLQSLPWFISLRRPYHLCGKIEIKFRSHKIHPFDIWKTKNDAPSNFQSMNKMTIYILFLGKYDNSCSFQ